MATSRAPYKTSSSLVPSVEEILQKALRKCYQEKISLEAMFDNEKVSIKDSFINLALTQEKEYREKEKKLGEEEASGEKEKGKGSKEGFQDKRLTSSETLFTVKEPFALTELFEPKDDTKTPHKVIIFGRAGIGKTILCQYLATQWASVPGESTAAVGASLASVALEEKSSADSAAAAASLSPVGDDNKRSSNAASPEAVQTYLKTKFKAVFWLRLRDIASKLTSEKEIHQIVRESCFLPGTSKKSLPSDDELETYLDSDNDSSHILFILDGYDEITERLNTEKTHPEEGQYLTYFFNQLANYQNILLTSRPMVIEQLGDRQLKADRQLENMGFLPEDIKAYIKRSMAGAQRPPQLADTMIQFLESHPSIWGLAHIPINLRLLCWLWSTGNAQFNSDDKLSVSRLYSKIVHEISEEYRNKLTRGKGKQKETREEKDALAIASANVDGFLNQLAYEAMQQESIIISSLLIKKSLRETLSTSDVAFATLHSDEQKERMNALLAAATNQLGFLRSTQEGGQESLDQTHYFIHLSFQEFFAARYFAHAFIQTENFSLSAKTSQYLIDQKYTPRYQLMWWLTAGLIYQDGKERKRLPDTQSSPHAGMYQSASAINQKKTVPFSALLNFWRVILAEPRDMIGPYHMALIMHCLDECEGDDTIPLHKALIDQQVKWLLFDYKKLKNHMSQCVLFQSSSFLQQSLMIATASENETVQGAALTALGRIQAPSAEVVTALLKGAASENKTVQRAAFEVLDKIQAPSAEGIAALLKGMASENIYVQGAALTALRRIQAPSAEASAVLLKGAASENETVQYAACKALGQIQAPSAEGIAALLKGAASENRDVQRAALEALGRIQAPSAEGIAVLVKGAVNENYNVQRAALTALGQIQNPSAEVSAALLKGTASENEDVQCAALDALGKIQTPSAEVSAVLLKGAASENETVQYAALAALGYIQNHSAEGIAVLLKGMASENYTVQRAALKVLGQIQNPSEVVIAVLLKGTASENWRVQYAALAALGQIQNPSAEVSVVLLKGTASANTNVQYAALRALGQIQNPSAEVGVALLKGAASENETVQCAAFCAMGKTQNPSAEVTAALLEGMASKNGTVQRAAREALGQIQNPSAEVSAVLLKGMTSENYTVQRAALKVLGQIQNPSTEVSAILLKGTTSENENVQIAALTALGKIQNPSAEVSVVLLKGTTSENKNVQIAAFTALGKIQNPSAEVSAALLKGAASENETVQSSSFEALGKIKNPSAEVSAALLKGAASENENVQGSALWALGQIQNLSAEVIAALLKGAASEDRDVQSVTRDALSKIQNPSAEGIVVLLKGTTSEDTDVQRAALTALGKIQNPSAEVIAVLLKRMTSENEYVQRASLQSLQLLSESHQHVITMLIQQAAAHDMAIHLWLKHYRFLYVKKAAVVCSPERAIYTIDAALPSLQQAHLTNLPSLLLPLDLPDLKQHIVTIAKTILGRPADIYHPRGFDNAQSDAILFPDGGSLFKATTQGNLELVQWLIQEGGVNINAIDSYGNTALMLAACYGHLDILNWLLEQGANPTTENQFKVSAIQLAYINNQSDSATALRDALDKIQEAANKIANEREKEEIGRVANQADRNPRLDRLLKKEALEEQLAQAIQYINAKPRLRHFYNHLTGRVDNLFIGIKAVDSGQVVRAQGDKEAIATGVIGAIGSAASMVPGASVGAAFINWMIGNKSKANAKKIADFVTRVMPTTEEVAKEAKALARLLTFQYEEQIMQLSDEGNKAWLDRVSDTVQLKNEDRNQQRRLAECVLGRMSGMLTEDTFIDRCTSFASHVSHEITHYKSNQGFLPWQDQEFALENHENTRWTDKDIFQSTGIRTIKGRLYGINIPALISISRSEEKSESVCDLSSQAHGYRLGTETDAKTRGLVEIPVVERTVHPLDLKKNNPYRWVSYVNTTLSIIDEIKPPIVSTSIELSSTAQPFTPSPSAAVSSTASSMPSSNGMFSKTKPGKVHPVSDGTLTPIDDGSHQPQQKSRGPCCILL